MGVFAFGFAMTSAKDVGNVVLDSGGNGGCSL